MHRARRRRRRIYSRFPAGYREAEEVLVISVDIHKVSHNQAPRLAIRPLSNFLSINRVNSSTMAIYEVVFSSSEYPQGESLCRLIFITSAAFEHRGCLQGRSLITPSINRAKPASFES